MIRRPPRSTQSRSSAASDVYKRQGLEGMPDGTTIQTANTLVMPADQEVCARMTSADVIHNFWPPKLNGKRYLIPGQETILRLQADEPGTYYAHCAEFCAVGVI